MIEKQILSRRIGIIPDEDEPPRVIVGEVLAVRRSVETVVLELIEDVEVDNQEVTYAVASARHEGVTFHCLSKGESILCGVTFATSAQFKKDKPFDVSWWRGGAARISTLLPLLMYCSQLSEA